MSILLKIYLFILDREKEQGEGQRESVNLKRTPRPTSSLTRGSTPQP